VVEVTAGDGKALLRQQQMLEVVQHACAAPAEVTVDSLAILLLRLPAMCCAQQPGSVRRRCSWMQRGVPPRYPRSHGAGAFRAQPAEGDRCARRWLRPIVETSSGHAVLDEAAVEELRGWHFVRGDAKHGAGA
jgi:hypothetical protein